MVRRACGIRSCVGAVLVAGLVAATVWWVRRSPLEVVTVLPAQPPWPTAHGRWLVVDSKRAGGGRNLLSATTVRPVSGGPARVLHLPAGLLGSALVAVTDTDAVYVVARLVRAGTVVDVYRLPLDGGAGAVVASGLNTAPTSVGCVVVGPSVYWVVFQPRPPWTPQMARRGVQPTAFDSALWTAPLRGGRARQLLSGSGVWGDLRAGDTGLTWEEWSANATGRALHHYESVGGRHTVWRDAPQFLNWGEWRGRYYLTEARVSGGHVSGQMWSCDLSGSDRKGIWPYSGPYRADAGGPRIPGCVMPHRGRLFLFLESEATGPQSLCELRADARGVVTLREVVPLPSDRVFRTYCDGGYCYLESGAPRRGPGWLSRWLAGVMAVGRRPALYRVKLPGG